MFSFTCRNQKAFFHGIGLKQPIKILFSTDNHVALTDSRDEPFRDNFKRMASFAKDQPEHFKKLIARANSGEYNLLALGGDLLNFPTAANMDFVSNCLAGCKIPWIYTAGNHDWHFEGLPGAEAELRQEWIQRRLLPLYQGRNPLIDVVEMNGLRIISLDNSIYNILPEQLERFKQMDSENIPTLLLCHVPMYVPGSEVFYGCGNPDWNAANDPYWQIERRPKWPEMGPSQTTLDFHRAVFTSKNVIGILAGHTHVFSVDCWQEKIQIVLEDTGSQGAFLEVTLD